MGCVVVYTNAALNDLREITAYIAADNEFQMSQVTGQCPRNMILSFANKDTEELRPLAFALLVLSDDRDYAAGSHL